MDVFAADDLLISFIFLLLMVLSLFQNHTGNGHKVTTTSFPDRRSTHPRFTQLRCCLMPVYHLGAHAILLGSLQGNPPSVALIDGLVFPKEACWLEEISSDFIPIFSRCFISRLTNIDSQLQTCRLQLIPFSLQLSKTAKGKCPMAIAYVFG